MTAQAVPKSVAQLVGGADWVVHTGGLGTHTTLASAISSASAGDRIVVASDLTITSTIAINKRVQIEFQDVTITNAASSSGVDTISTGVAVGQNGTVAGVRIHGRLALARSGTGKAGHGINFHGAYQWLVDDLTVSDHASAVYFDASPYPTGQSSKNTVRSLYATTCTVGIKNTSSANINTVYDAHTYSCGQDLLHESGLNLNVFGFRVENTVNSQTSPRIQVDGGSVWVYGLHGEVGPSDPVVQIASGAYASVDGDVYGGTGDDAGHATGAKLTADTAATGYHLRLKSTDPPMQRGLVDMVVLPSISATTTVTGFRAFNKCRIREIGLYNNGFINYGVSDYWAVTFEEYNGNVDVGAISTVTQAAQIGYGAFGDSALTHTLASGRLIRVIFTKTGNPSSWTNPMLYVRWDNI